MITEGMEIYQKSIVIFQKGIGEDLTKPLKIVLTYVVIVYVMELIAYGKYNAVTMTRNIIIIYIITFILSGAVNAYYWENRVDGINVTKTILLVFFIEIFLVVLVKRSQKDVSITSLYQVTLLVDGNRINVRVFPDGAEIVENYSGDFDIILMDIQMKYMDGMTAAEQIRKLYNTDIPELWAGMGRAVNNAGAVITSFTSVLLLSSANTMIISVVALVLFALISVAIYAYSTQLVISVKEPVSTEPAVNYKLERFVQAYSLTEREKEVLQVLTESDGNVSELASTLCMSRSALYRHISAINEKTDTSSRIGLIQFYYSWSEN